MEKAPHSQSERSRLPLITPDTYERTVMVVRISPEEYPGITRKHNEPGTFFYAHYFTTNPVPLEDLTTQELRSSVPLENLILRQMIHGYVSEHVIAVTPEEINQIRDIEKKRIVARQKKLVKTNVRLGMEIKSLQNPESFEGTIRAYAQNQMDTYISNHTSDPLKPNFETKYQTNKADEHVNIALAARLILETKFIKTAKELQEKVGANGISQPIRFDLLHDALVKIVLDEALRNTLRKSGHLLAGISQNKMYTSTAHWLAACSIARVPETIASQSYIWPFGQYQHEYKEMNSPELASLPYLYASHIFFLLNLPHAIPQDKEFNRAELVAHMRSVVNLEETPSTRSLFFTLLRYHIIKRFAVPPTPDLLQMSIHELMKLKPPTISEKELSDEVDEIAVQTNHVGDDLQVLTDIFNKNPELLNRTGMKTEKEKVRNDKILEKFDRIRSVYLTSPDRSPLVQDYAHLLGLM